MLKFKDWMIAFFLIVFSPALYALTTFVVTLPTDNRPWDIGESGDLRYYLNMMNQDLNTGHDADFEITFAFPMTIYLNGLLPIINNSASSVNITIGNSGATPNVIIDGQDLYSGFFIPMGNVTIQNMIFQHLKSKGGNGGSGISGGGGGMGAGGAIYASQTFLYGTSPSITLRNVSITNCSAQGGDGGNSFITSGTGNEGGGGGGGFSGNGGSVVVNGTTGGAGGGGFGGNGGDVTLSTTNPSGGAGGGGGGIGSRAGLGTPTNLGNGGSDQLVGEDGNGYGLSITAGSGAGGYAGGIRAGGGGGGAGLVVLGGGGGGSNGTSGLQGQGFKMRRDGVTPSGGTGGDGAGGGGGGLVMLGLTNLIDGAGGPGGYAGGGGGGAGAGASGTDYTVQGGIGGIGGGGGGGGVNQSGSTSAQGGDSSAGGGGGGGGPSNILMASGGSDIGNLGGGSGGAGANSIGPGSGGGGGGGGSGLGGAIFIDSNLNFTIEALSGVPTLFNTSNNTTQAGIHGTGAAGASDGTNGSALGNSIFLRAGSSLTFKAQDASDVLTLGPQVGFTDDTTFGAGGTVVNIKGNGTIIYNGTTDYQGTIRVNNANFKVNGSIDQASIQVCRDLVTSQRGTLSGTGVLTGTVFVNSGTIFPDTGGTLTLGSLTLSPATGSSLGSLVHTHINSSGTSLVSVTGATSLAGILEIELDTDAVPGQYTILTSPGGITGTFDSITFTGGRTPSYSLSYLPVGAPTYVQFDFLGYPPTAVDIPATVNGSAVLNPAVVCCGRPVILGPLPVPGPEPTIYTVTSHTGNITCQIGQSGSQTYLQMHGNNGSCTIIGTKGSTVSNPLTVIAP